MHASELVTLQQGAHCPRARTRHTRDQASRRPLLVAARCRRRVGSLTSSFACRAATGSDGLRRLPQEPLGSRVLTSILTVSEVPYSSYVPQPRTVLHKVDARIKEVWVIAILLLLSRASATMRLAIAGGLAAVTMAALPARLWRAQLTRLAGLAALLFAFTALGADGVPPVTQPRAPPAALQGLPALSPAVAYRYVLLKLGPITITRRSVSLAIAASALTFTGLQSASLVLTTTAAEDLAVALRSLLLPLRLLRVPVQEIGLSLLLALRFMALVFEEGRNLALGLAARGIAWDALGPSGGLRLLLHLGGRLFANLMQRSENIAVAMTARGFGGARAHRLYLTRPQPSSGFANLVALLLLAATTTAVYIFQ